MRIWRGCCFGACMAMFGGSWELVAQTERLEITDGDGGTELRWQSKVPRWTGKTPLSMRYQAYQSDDLKTWSAVGEPLVGQGDAGMRLTLDSQATQQYYRLESEPEFQFFDKNSDTVVSYGDQQDYHFAGLENLTLEDFEQQYGATEPYRERITWDVKQAQFWDMFAMSPEEHNAGRPADDPERRLYDFRLNERESAMMQTNGFVVTPRHQRNTFIDMFYDIWTDDLPVYFSTDAALQAWHRSYQVMLSELEEVYLRQELLSLIASMRATFPSVWAAHGEGPLGEGLRDVDFYLTVADSLLQVDDPLQVDGGLIRLVPHLADQDQVAKVHAWLDLIEEHMKLERGGPFGTPMRLTDFSQFTVRGNYTSSATLTSYFRTMTWLGQIDFRMAGGSEAMGTLRQLSGAVSLSLLLRESEEETRWQSIEDVIAMFVGLSDSMTPPQMLGLLDGQGFGSFASFDDVSDLTNLQSTVLAGPYGKQEILGAPIENCGETELVLPRSFNFFGQRFTPDSWSLAEVTYDRVPFSRRMPLSLDVAFATFDNRAVVPLLASHMRDTNGRAFRDGYAYQPYLAAAHATLQSQEPAFWTTNMYQNWLGSLRALSPPTTGGQFPEAMQTEAWAMKNLSTQLASWTQLRHDTILYVKQSVSPPLACFYPAGYVEPRVAFWESLGAMARSAGRLVAGLEMSGTALIHRDPHPDFGFIEPLSLNVETSQKGMVDHFDRFAEASAQLAAISRRELEQLPLTEEQQIFIETIVEGRFEYAGIRTYTGWYPNLYYNSRYAQFVSDDHPSDFWDPLVVDVHTDAPSICGSDGAVLHEAVGNVDFMMLGVSHGEEQGCVYGGPVFSYYEMIEPYPNRLTDEQWKARVNSGELPPRPEWTEAYLAD